MFQCKGWEVSRQRHLHCLKCMDVFSYVGEHKCCLTMSIHSSIPTFNTHSLCRKPLSSPLVLSPTLRLGLRALTKAELSKLFATAGKTRIMFIYILHILPTGLKPSQLINIIVWGLLFQSFLIFSAPYLDSNSKIKSFLHDFNLCGDIHHLIKILPNIIQWLL